MGHEIRKDLGIISEEELADALGVLVTTLGDWRKKKTGPAHTPLGKAIFYRCASVDAWICAQEVQKEKTFNYVVSENVDEQDRDPKL
jgi:predicted DNA-binding transcriptional regulator AlpA